ncbi:MAG TPA: trehalase family glycosidase, partial [Chloroflexota bacterium]|nr:trehalase family glycosidase [Chloroflexota bacterium]
IGPGYCYGPAFGHWDLIHQVLDTLPAEPAHARDQLLNLLSTQQDDGYLPAQVWIREGRAQPAREQTHPPVWPLAVQWYVDRTGQHDLLHQAYPALIRQLRWFEDNRQVGEASGIGFYYRDIVNRRWESGIDEGVRFDDAPEQPLACVDATSHLYLAYMYAARWAWTRGEDGAPFEAKAGVLRDFIQRELFSQETGFFHDVWSVRDSRRRPLAHEGMWPVVVGAATPEQAQRCIDENLLNPERFFTTHPISTVGRHDPRFELRMWRGPTWNSMTLWAALGCQRYGRADAARRLTERAVDACAKQFAQSGTVWEFYHPDGDDPLTLQRKPQTKQNTPCPDYLGHNPIIALARTWVQTGQV